MENIRFPQLCLHGNQARGSSRTRNSFGSSRCPTFSVKLIAHTGHSYEYYENSLISLVGLGATNGQGLPMGALKIENRCKWWQKPKLIRSKRFQYFQLIQYCFGEVLLKSKIPSVVPHTIQRLCTATYSRYFECLPCCFWDVQVWLYVQSNVSEQIHWTFAHTKDPKYNLYAKRYLDVS